MTTNLASDHRYQHGLQQQLWIPTRPSAATVDINMACCSSMDHGHQHGPQYKYRPRTSPQPPAAKRCSSDHRHQHSPQGKHRPQTDISMSSHGSLDHGHQHTLQQAAQTLTQLLAAT
ncbi:hypothetical protein STEG23_021686 [Scotinomys teguina]